MIRQSRLGFFMFKVCFSLLFLYFCGSSVFYFFFEIESPTLKFYVIIANLENT